jgi:hypothetical protein
MESKEDHDKKRKAHIAKETINHKANVAHIKATVTPDYSEFINNSDPEPF